MLFSQKGIVMTQVFAEYMLGIAEELRITDELPIESAVSRLGLVTAIRNIRNEAAAGAFTTANGERVTIDSEELRGVLFVVMAENWLTGLAHEEGRSEDASRHFRNYIAAIKRIDTAEFTDEEKGKAHAILD